MLKATFPQVSALEEYSPKISYGKKEVFCKRNIAYYNSFFWNFKHALPFVSVTAIRGVPMRKLAHCLIHNFQIYLTIENILGVTTAQYLLKLTFHGLCLGDLFSEADRALIYWPQSTFISVFCRPQTCHHSHFLGVLCAKLVVSQPHNVFYVYMLMPLHILVCLEEPAQI